jgi:hypothetical protein
MQQVFSNQLHKWNYQRDYSSVIESYNVSEHTLTNDALATWQQSRGVHGRAWNAHRDRVNVKRAQAVVKSKRRTRQRVQQAKHAQHAQHVEHAQHAQQGGQILNTDFWSRHGLNNSTMDTVPTNDWPATNMNVVNNSTQYVTPSNVTRALSSTDGVNHDNENDSEHSSNSDENSSSDAQEEDVEYRWFQERLEKRVKQLSVDDLSILTQEAKQRLRSAEKLFAPCPRLPQMKLPAREEADQTMSNGGNEANKANGSTSLLGVSTPTPKRFQTKSLYINPLFQTLIEESKGYLSRIAEQDARDRQMTPIYETLTADSRSSQVMIGMDLYHEAFRLIDEFRMQRSTDQRRFHEAIFLTVAPHIIKEDYPRVREELLAKHGRDNENMATLILCPRRWGKTTSVAMIMAVLMRVCRGVQIVIFSTGKSSSCSLLRQIKDFFLELEQGSGDRIVTNSSNELHTLPADMNGQKGSRLGIPRDRCNHILAMSGNVTGRHARATRQHRS